MAWYLLYNSPYPWFIQKLFKLNIIRIFSRSLVDNLYVLESWHMLGDFLFENSKENNYKYVQKIENSKHFWLWKMLCIECLWIKKQCDKNHFRSLSWTFKDATMQYMERKKIRQIFLEIPLMWQRLQYKCDVVTFMGSNLISSKTKNCANRIQNWIALAYSSFVTRYCFLSTGRCNCKDSLLFILNQDKSGERTKWISQHKLTVCV